MSDNKPDTSIPLAANCAGIDPEALASAIANAIANLEQINVAFDPTKWNATQYCDADGNIKGTHFVCLVVDGDGADDGEPAGSQYWVPADGGDPVPGPPPADCKPCGPPFTFDDDGNLCVSFVQKPGTKLDIAEQPTMLSTSISICGPDGAKGTCYSLLVVPAQAADGETPMTCQLVALGAGLMGVTCCPDDDDATGTPGEPVKVEYYCTPDGITNEMPTGWAECPDPLEAKLDELIAAVNNRPDRLDFEFYCDIGTGTLHEIPNVNGVRGAPVDTGIACVAPPSPDVDVEVAFVCDVATNLYNRITTTVTDGVSVEVVTATTIPCDDDPPAVDVEVDFVCNMTTGFYDEIRTTVTNGGAPVQTTTATTRPCSSPAPNPQDYEQVRVCRNNTIHIVTHNLTSGTPVEVSAIDTAEPCGIEEKPLGPVKYLRSLDEWDATSSALIGTTGGSEVVQVGDAKLTITVEDNGQDIIAYAGGLGIGVGGYGLGVQAARCMDLSWEVPEGCVMTYRITGNYVQAFGDPRMTTKFDPCPTKYTLQGNNQRFENGHLFTQGGNSNAVNDGITVQVVGTGSTTLTFGYQFSQIRTQALRGVEVRCYGDAVACQDLVTDEVSYVDPTDPTRAITLADLERCPQVDPQPVDCGGCESCADCCEDLSFAVTPDVYLNSSWYNRPTRSKCPTDQVHYRIGEITQGNTGTLAYLMIGLTSFPESNYFTHLDYAAYVVASSTNSRRLYAYENNNSQGSIQLVRPDDVICVVRKGDIVFITVNGEKVHTFPTPASDKPLYASSSLLNTPNRGTFDVEVSTCPLSDASDPCAVDCACDPCESWPMSKFKSNIADGANNSWANQGPYSACPVKKTCWTLGEREGRIPLMFGLGEGDPTTSASYTSFGRMRFYYYQISPTQVQYGVYDNGVFQGWSGYEDIPEGTEFCIEHLPDGHLSAQRDGVEFYRSTLPFDGSLYADSSYLGAADGSYWNGFTSMQVENCR